MAKSKEDLIKEYKKLKARLGKSPSRSEFTNETGVSRHALDRNFGSNAWAKLVKSCGDNPKEFLRQKSDLGEILAVYGLLARELGKIPTVADWKFKGLTPTESGIRESHKIRWTELAERFHAYAQDKKEWSDIIDLFNEYSEVIEPTSPSKKDGYVYLISFGRHYKIGRTENLERRLKEVRFGLPEDGKLVHVISTDDPPGIEAYWHNRFKHCRAINNSEFFKLKPSDVRAFKRRKFQ